MPSVLDITDLLPQLTTIESVASYLDTFIGKHNEAPCLIVVTKKQLENIYTKDSMLLCQRTDTLPKKYIHTFAGIEMVAVDRTTQPSIIRNPDPKPKRKNLKHIHVGTSQAEATETFNILIDRYNEDLY